MEEKNNVLKLKVQINDEEIRLNHYLKNYAKCSSRFIRKAAREGRIKVNNNENVRLSYMLKNNDLIELQINRKEEQDIVPEKMSLDIIYEDEDIIVINKPKGIVVHPTKRHLNGTLSNGVLYYFKEKNENSIVRLVNRLDMDTSGLVLIAKNAYSHMALSRDMQKDDFIKRYLAIVHGNLEEKSGVIDKPIYRVGEGTLKRVIDERGQKSITRFKVIESYENADLIELTLETGRTHQIRVHLSSIGHPIYGDALYGKEEHEYIDRQALHAYKLQIPHPKDGRILKLQSDLPDDMKNLIDKLKK
ncbi:pseudouridylate synthase [Clostridium novyi A str. 4552]|uniref:Pseudouridine synthase n=1 Tax=Clostridium novyi A str. 4552 TaxID=1444289 RepID=A0A0A0IBL8_CLONO|nr:RluA family pseudouridine synthase [Clostridium novyi]KGM97928.1 pseudouridylate synthase [Clostridium novyi A str. 4552]